MKVPRLVGVIAIAVAIPLSLGSCFAFDPPIGGASIQRDGDSVRIAMCVSVTDASGIVTYRQLDVANEWVDAWKLPANGDLAVGSVFSTGSDTIPLKEGVEIAVRITSQGQDDGEVFADFVIPPSGLSSELWLGPDGSESAGPCAE